MESLYIFKDFFNKIIKNNNYDCRSNNQYVNNSKREDYLFNSKINGVEECDFIFLIGSNIRHEATILNSRIRKSCLNNNTKIISLNDQGDLTFPYENLNGDSETIKRITEDNHPVSELLINAKKPMIILGPSVLENQSGKYIFESLKKFLFNKNKISENWNPLNVISLDASRIGSLDLGIINSGDGYNNLLNDLNKNKFEIVFLFGQDNLTFDKKNEFVIYIGSHGDRGAELADIILPGSAYTEQDGYFTNIEGKLQKAYKASYPPGDAKEDWEIINDLSENISGKKLYQNKNELEKAMIGYLNIFYEQDKLKKIELKNNVDFVKEKIETKKIDYYYSNVIARASRTMAKCREVKDSKA